MARRARQKRRRGQDTGPRPAQPHRDNVPGSLDHASGEVEEFDAALVAGAGGGFDEKLDDVELADAVTADAEARRAVGMGMPTAHQPVASQGGNRVFGFLRACWAELQRVQWPDRAAVGQATAVVMGFVVIAGAYLGLADVVAKKIIDFIL